MIKYCPKSWRMPMIRVNMKKWKINYLPPFLYLVSIITICYAFLVTPPFTSKLWFRIFCQNMPFIAQNPLKLEAYSDTRQRYMCGLLAMYIFWKLLEYFRSVWNAKKYFIQIKCRKYLPGRKSTHIPLPGVWICF